MEVDNDTLAHSRRQGDPMSVSPTATAQHHAPPQLILGDGKTLLDDLPLESIVKVFCVVTSPNYSMPWQMKRQMKTTASGFVISGRRIITNAHGIANQTSVLVRKHGSPEKVTARVLAVGHELDLAILTVDTDHFWHRVIPLEFGGVPNLQESVIVVGYPTGGDNISVTGGVVSRVEIQTYSHAASSLLAIQIDAAINAGNSGGPAFRNGKVIGVAFETLADADNIGYIIPVPVIEHFLKDIAVHGRYTGLCSIGFYWQALENEQFRRSLQMPPGMTGVYVSKVQPLAPATRVLRKGDVLLRIDGVEVANDGTIPFRKGERIAFRYLTSQKFISDSCHLTLLRDGQVLEVSVMVDLVRQLVPVHLYDQLPSYYIFAGLVFVPLSQPYLRNEYGKDWETKAPVKLCNIALDGMLSEVEEQVVLLSQVLAANVNIGYQLAFANVQVVEFNGKKIRNLRELASMCEGCEAEYATFRLENDKVIVLEAAAARASTPEILKQHAIPADRSPDVAPRPPASATGEPQPGPSRSRPEEPGPAGPATPRRAGGDPASADGALAPSCTPARPPSAPPPSLTAARTAAAAAGGGSGRRAGRRPGLTGASGGRSGRRIAAFLQACQCPHRNHMYNSQ
eukprot:tig00001094_g6985.t2